MNTIIIIIFNDCTIHFHGDIVSYIYDSISSKLTLVKLEFSSVEFIPINSLNILNKSLYIDERILF